MARRETSNAHTLERYNAMRDFEATAEPRGRVAAEGGQSFVVQKHHARRLHYDFRLELDGVLKSWAVPRGPSLSPKEKRLAVETEDHPVDYRDFEGTIPKGQYGAGAVIVWDRGTWTSNGDPHEGLRKGHLEFSLEGEKLRGRYTLIRLAPKKDADRPSDRAWLLVKRSDAHAREGDEADVVTAHPESILSGHTIEDVEAGAPPRERTRRRKRADRGAVTTDPLPAFGSVSPALATLVSEIPIGPWVYEIKYDGYRVVTTLDRGTARIASRSGRDWTAHFPEIAEAVTKLRARTAIFDGEVAYVAKNGHTDFQGLQLAAHGDRQKRARVSYFIFDLLYVDGRDLRGETFDVRYDFLRTILAGVRAPIVLGRHLTGDGRRFFREACARGLEGIVAKRSDRPYPEGRTHDWVKRKCHRRQEFVIAGFTPRKGAEAGIGALLLSVREGARYRYVGKVGTGFSQKTLRHLGERLTPLADPRRAPPVGAPPIKHALWVKPELVCEVRFANWTHDGVLRHSSFEGLRDDKRPDQVFLETAEPSMTTNESDPTNRGDAHEVLGVTITHRNRVVDPESGLTKLDLVRYGEKVSEEFLSWASKRPLLLVRCTGEWPKNPLGTRLPERRKGPCFVQRSGEGGTLRGVGHGHVGDEPVLFVTKPSEIALLMQLNTVEFHGWGARLPDAQKPDWMVFDLDPDEGLAWSAVVDAAFEVRDALEKIGLTSFAKTTGGKGLHVVVPLRPKDDWPVVRAFAAWIAQAFASSAPSRYVATMSKAKRAGKIFIDHFRNAEGATAILPYSPRTRPYAPVAMPIGWSDLRHVDPGEFTVRSVPTWLVKRRVDPWAAMKDVTQTIPEMALRLLGDTARASKKNHK